MTGSEINTNVRLANGSERSIVIDASNGERQHEGATEARPSLLGAESSEDSEASSPRVKKKSRSDSINSRSDRR